MNKLIYLLCVLIITPLLPGAEIEYHTWIAQGIWEDIDYTLNTISVMNNSNIGRQRPLLNPYIYIRGNEPPFKLDHPDEYGYITGTDNLIADSNLTPYYSTHNVDYEQIDATVQQAVSCINAMFTNNPNFTMGDMVYDDEGYCSNEYDVIITFIYDEDNYDDFSDPEISLGFASRHYIHDTYTNESYIKEVEIGINCTNSKLVPDPPLLDFQYWDISHDQPLEQDGYLEYYLLRTIMHEILHAWGLGHIDTQGAVMY